MDKKQKIIVIFTIIIMLILGIFIFRRFSKKITYLEYKELGTNCEDILDMSENSFVIEQEFHIPYEMFQGVGLKIGTYGRENNSRYELIVMDKTTDKSLTSFEFNTSQAEDNEIYELLLDSAIPIDSTHQFSVIIRAKTRVNNENGVAFYADKNTEKNENLYYNQNQYDAKLCMYIYGGNRNGFWLLFALICEIYGAVFVSYILYLYSHQKSILKNSMVQAGLLGIAVFSLLAVLSGMETFSDEVDNIIGGMLIQKGYVLYVDYYTQHTPFAYFLCAFVSWLGACSVMQFRLLYDGIIAFIYAGLYLRHSKQFGKVKMGLLPILQILLGMLIAKETAMILSDNIQAVCMIVLILEFLQYLKDEKLDWKRASIVSLSIFCGFMSAFVSVYAIFAVCLGVFIKEILYWKNCGNISLKNVIVRYWKLVVACAIPFIIFGCYLLKTHSLVGFYEQAYQFNTAVYPYYLQDGFGTNVLQPFFIGITNVMQVIPNAVQNVIANQEVMISIVNIILEASLIVILLNMWQKREFLKMLILVLFVSFGFTRTNENFHSVAVWASILTIVIMHMEWGKMPKSFAKVISIIFILCMAGNYMNICTTYLFKKIEPISKLDQKIISETKEGEKIFYDIYSNPSVYLIYKNRYPINRLGFILPWYMDWYELDTIDDLRNKRPRVVIYDEQLKAWEISGYDDYLRKYLHENYEQIPENGKMWILKES